LIERTGGEHLVDVLEGAGLVHLRQRSPQRPPAPGRIWEEGERDEKGADPVRTGRPGERRRRRDFLSRAPGGGIVGGVVVYSADLCSPVVASEYESVAAGGAPVTRFPTTTRTSLLIF
jgi:hypothetical protein